MKLLHTSDWHLGHTLHNYDRTDEQMYMLMQMVDIVREHKPDVFLLCGDVYHTPQPSSATQTMFANALVEIHKANPTMPIVITAGNHDSGAKHDIFRVPWKALNVYTIGCVDADTLDDMLIDVPGKGIVIAVPYVHERNMPEKLYQRLLDKANERNGDSIPIVMMAHTAVSGSDFTGHDNVTERTVGGIDSCTLEDMGTGYDYLALGHIHHAQSLHNSRGKARYSGSPLPINFDESYPHSVSLVEIGGRGGTAVVDEIAINTHRPLVTLPSQGFATWDDAKRLLEEFPRDIEAYIRLNVEVRDMLPVEANAEAHIIAENKKCRFCLINPQRMKGSRREAKVMSVSEFKTEAPIDIAQRYAEDIGAGFDDDMCELFRETVAEIEDEERR